MDAALAAQRRDAFADAERLYRAALTIDPDAVDALHMIGAIYFRTGRLGESYDLIREALERTEWRIPMIRQNFALLLSTMLGTDDAVEALLSGDQELRVRIDADSRRCADALGVPFAGPIPLAVGRAAGIDRARARVLVLDDSVPAPDRDSGSRRLVAILRILRTLGCELTLVARVVEFGSPYVEGLRAMGVEVLCQPDVWSIQQVLTARGREFDVVWACRYRVAQECGNATRRCAPNALFVLDTVDLHYLREGREAEVTGDPDVRRRAVMTYEQELAMIRDADVTVVVSDSERSALRELLPTADVRVVSNVLPTESAAPGFSGRRDMLFVGAFNHRPNVDAIKWYVEEVWPQVRRRLPEARTYVVGSDMPAAVRDLAGLGIETLGYVPDLEPYLQRCRLSIAPLRFGAGVKGKINEAQAAGLPVVATSIAVEGMHLESGRDVLVADSASSFADAIVHLHENELLWSQVASGGRENVARYFSAEAARPVLDGLIAAAGAPQEIRVRKTPDIRYLVLVPAAYGSLGDAAMVHGTVKGINERFPHAQIDLLSIYQGEHWPRIPGVGKVILAFPQACSQPQWEARFRRIAAGYDAFAVLGADVLDGHYDLEESMARLALARLARDCGLETRVLGFSVNDHPAEAACAALREIGATTPLFVRDAVSLLRLEARGVPGLLPCADVAFLMQPAGASPSWQQAQSWIVEQRAAGRPVVAFNMSSPVLANAVQAGNARMLQDFVALIAALERSHRVSALIVPHDLRAGSVGGHDDTTIAYRICALLERNATPIPHHLFVTGDAPEVKALVGRVDLAVTGRMHLAIAALGMAVPVVVLAYQGKFDGMMQQFGFEPMAVEPQFVDVAELHARCAHLLDDAAGVRTTLGQRLPEVLTLARANFAGIAMLMS